MTVKRADVNDDDGAVGGSVDSGRAFGRSGRDGEEDDIAVEDVGLVGSGVRQAVKQAG